ncbi:unnamed protein product [Closterium sp. Naga37s-1]|nr:unnamed protein product [Closterium sp. Naga37s-1]
MSASLRMHSSLSARTLYPRYKPNDTLNASNLSSLQTRTLFASISQKPSLRLRLRSPSPALVTAQAGKGFGKKPAASSKAKPAGSSAGSSKLLDELGAASTSVTAPSGKAAVAGAEAADAAVCPCGGSGEGEKRAYKECCARYHGGVKEPDAVSLMKARYTAFARGVIPYIVRTTHEDNPNMAPGGAEGRKKLTADCEETCKRLVFKRLKILSTEAGESDDVLCQACEETCKRLVFKRLKILPTEAGENDDVSAGGTGVNLSSPSEQSTPTYKHGTTTDNQILVEKSRFVRDPDTGRWLYREKTPLDALPDSPSPPSFIPPPPTPCPFCLLLLSQESFVSFRAVYAYKHGTTTDIQILVEKSRFVRDPESGRWLYREKVPTLVPHSPPSPLSQESFVSFRAVYAYKHGTTTDNQILVEKSRFLRDPESGRWLYREKIPLDAASEAAWRLGPALVEQEQQAGGRKSYVMRGAAQPKLRPRSS